jgi:hypothetical protein
MLKAITGTLAAAVVSLTLCGLDTKALANSPTVCSVFDVAFVPNSGDQLYFHCYGDFATYQAFSGPNSAGCPQVPIDQMKIWVALVTTADITRNSLTIKWSGATCIDSLSLSR